MIKLEEIADRLEIQELMYRYGLAVDRRDWTLYRSVFTADAMIDYREVGGALADLETTVGFLSEVIGTFVGLQHNMTNHMVELAGDTARACTYFTAYHSMLERGGESLIASGGFYDDELRRTPDGWRISRRREQGLWIDDACAKRYGPSPWYGTPDHNIPPIYG
ncbi:nuclear transport factor 2 family protein [Spirillospora sp. CA-255316]